MEKVDPEHPSSTTIKDYKCRASISTSLKPGSLMYIVIDHTPPLSWPLTPVVHLIPGPEGISRVANLKTPT
ncbi:unnamed protein product [Larinioides sclopetarius]|uniref:DUF5641 domain-containing protein n=1 Tax=Larinioides sclopetarius TaxID=280406 RepID=A0AAV1ZT75_9ARAC